MWELDVRRFGAYANSVKYVSERACDVYEREYAIHYPEEERPAGRPLKTSRLHDRLLAKGQYSARDSDGSARSGSPWTAGHETSIPSVGETGTRLSGTSAAPFVRPSGYSIRRALLSTKYQGRAQRDSSTASAQTHFRTRSAEWR